MHRRSEFLRIQRSGLRQRTAHFVIYLAKLPGSPGPRMGVTVSRAMGGAVVRNRLKRRLREGFRRCLKPLLDSGYAMVVIAREGAAELPTAAIVDEISPALLGLASRLRTRSSVAG